jgi:hypothetical protein
MTTFGVEVLKLLTIREALKLFFGEKSL